jgi:hypothetical protein
MTEDQALDAWDAAKARLRQAEQDEQEAFRTWERIAQGRPVKFKAAAPAKPKVPEPPMSILSAGLNAIGARR